MNLQVLVATMHQTDYNLLEKMNIQSDSIIGNQCDRNEIEKFEYNGHKIKYLSFTERGVGLNRNNALMRAIAYVIVFNLIEEQSTRYTIKEKYKVNLKNYMRFGAVIIGFKTRSITKNGISFNIHFGGGTKHSSGEDVLFLTDCLKKQLNIIAVPISIAYLTKERSSTWFEGYTDKFFKDKGNLFHYILKRWAKFLCLQFAIRRETILRWCLK